MGRRTVRRDAAHLPPRLGRGQVDNALRIAGEVFAVFVSASSPSIRDPPSAQKDDTGARLGSRRYTTSLLSGSSSYLLHSEIEPPSQKESQLESV